MICYLGGLVDHVSFRLHLSELDWEEFVSLPHNTAQHSITNSTSAYFTYTPGLGPFVTSIENAG